MKNRLIAIIAAAVLCAAALLIYNVRHSEKAPAEAAESPVQSETATADESVLPLDTAAYEHREGELVFGFTIADFVDNFNAIYSAEGGTLYFKETSRWTRTLCDSAPHSPYSGYCYRFSADEAVLPYPKTTVYTPDDDKRIDEITFDFDDHSYTEALHKAYGTMCFYALKTVLPSMTDGDVVKLYDALDALARENFVTIPYGADAVPGAVYYQGSVAVYPYFAAGESLHICIIPADEARLAQFEEAGSKIYKIDEI